MRHDVQALKDAQGIIENTAGDTISEYFKDLLTNKYLYQSLEVKPREADSTQNLDKTTFAYLQFYKIAFDRLWSPLGLNSESKLVNSQKLPIIHTTQFELKIVKRLCPHCRSPEPLHPLWDLVKVYDKTSWKKFSHLHQLFVLPYECQNCKGEPIIFTVQRNVQKIQLCGVNFPTKPLAPDFIPKAQKNFFEEALLAFQVNKILTAIFYLRVFIEQYWYAVLNHKLKDKCSVEDLGKEYNKKLGKLSSEIPSLVKVYDKLSSAIHEAKSDLQLFEEMRSKIEEHFQRIKVEKTYNKNFKLQFNATP